MTLSLTWYSFVNIILVVLDYVQNKNIVHRMIFKHISTSLQEIHRKRQQLLMRVNQRMQLTN